MIDSRTIDDGRTTEMKIGIIGAGNIGATAAKLFAEAGHQVVIANSRGPDTLQSLVQAFGEGATAATIQEAATFGEVVLVAIPFGKYQTLPSTELQGKIVIDANNYYPGRDGHVAELDHEETTSSELLATHLRGAKVVKGFNTIWYEHLRTQGNTDLPLEARRVIFIAGDDPETKAIVARLIEEIGFAVVDTGTLREGGKRQQPDTPIYNKTLTVAQANQLLA
jgi:predicted dinucleotide-binding enzyme